MAAGPRRPRRAEYGAAPCALPWLPARTARTARNAGRGGDNVPQPAFPSRAAANPFPRVQFSLVAAPITIPTFHGSYIFEFALYAVLLITHDPEADLTSYEYARKAVEKEKYIENFLEKHIKVLDRSVFVIGRQVRIDDKNRIDLMGIDRDGNAVIIEIKRSMSHEDGNLADLGLCRVGSKCGIRRAQRDYQKETSRKIR